MKDKYWILIVLFIVWLSSRSQQRITDKARMVFVGGGTFHMGIDSAERQAAIQKYGLTPAAFSQEYPSRRVTVAPFFMDRYPVTNADFKQFIDANPAWSKANIPLSLNDGNYLKDWKGDQYPKAKANYPVVYVCWYAAVAYGQWRGKRLPSEAEMEFAAKSNNPPGMSVFPWCDADIDVTKANYQQSAIGHAVAVGQYPPNSLGLYDMAGNVFEFCLDSWRSNLYQDMINFKTKRFATPDWPRPDEKVRTVRGGSWGSPAALLRTSYREGRAASSCTADLGFRCALTFKAEK